MKKTLRTLLVVMLAFILCFAIIGCKDNNAELDPDDKNLEQDANDIDKEADNAYFIEIEGINVEKIIVTKAQIFEIAKTKEVVYTFDDPCYASDKTDDDGELIPHSLKGVYLDDILDVYADGAVSGAFSALSIMATDTYGTIITSDTYNEEHGGSKMIIAYEYDDIILNEKQASGALRVVFPDQVANSWVKKLKTIIFSDAELVSPQPITLNFMELLDNSYNGSFQKEVVTDADSSNYTFYGISIAKLLEGNILNADEDDKMYFSAWDYKTNGTDSYYKEYTGWKSYEFYQDSFLVYELQKEGGEKEKSNHPPTLEGVNIKKGMSIKNTLALTVKDTALVSLELAFDRYDKESTNEILLKDVLKLVNLYNETASYSIVDSEGNTVTVPSLALEEAKLTKTSGVYTLQYGTNSLAIKSISINK